MRAEASPNLERGWPSRCHYVHVERAVSDLDDLEEHRLLRASVLYGALHGERLLPIRGGEDTSARALDAKTES